MTVVNEIAHLLKENGHTAETILNVQKLIQSNEEFSEEINSKNKLLSLSNKITNSYHEGMTSARMLELILDTIEEIDMSRGKKKMRHIAEVFDDFWKQSLVFDPRGGIAGYHCDRLGQITRAIDGFKSGVYFVGGGSNVGKSVFVITTALGVLESN